MSIWSPGDFSASASQTSAGLWTGNPFVTLEIPLLEKWSESLNWLSRSQRERFNKPEFYEILQHEIATRLRSLPSSSV